MRLDASGSASDRFRAVCFDRAVWTFGTTVEADMDEAEKGLGPKAKDRQKNAARQRVLDQYLFIGERPTAGRFRDPAAMTRRRG